MSEPVLTAIFDPADQAEIVRVANITGWTPESLATYCWLQTNGEPEEIAREELRRCPI